MEREQTLQYYNRIIEQKYLIISLVVSTKNEVIIVIDKLDTIDSNPNYL